ncbi:DUF4115 domain-containing protein [Catenovulum sp. SM1970]|uniref:RodZ domain-containing protein n=1 Tax=Marinifaba aquimaris TaxID=2741323 RepID=UPI001573D04B|nr:RodZ domain-containing protein [Marinifaba aquimaris]NTS75486.1 DUF4115 domain-containing protein [Marinifaba aquimaris]
MSESNKELKADITPGQLLRQHRQAQKLSQQDVADSLNLKLEIVVALEENNFKEIGEPIYVKGYLRSNARLLGLNEADLIAIYEKVSNHESNAKMTSFSQRTQKEANDNRLMLLTYLIIAVMIGFVVLWWQGTSKTTLPDTEISTETQSLISSPITDNQTEEKSDESTGTATATDKQQTSTFEQGTTETEETAATESELLTLTEIITETTTEETQSSVQPKFKDEVEKPSSIELDMIGQQLSASDRQLAGTQTKTKKVVVKRVKKVVRKPVAEATEASVNKAQPEVSPETQLTINFTDDCWTVIHDATGKRVAYNLYKAGRELTLTGVAPFKMLLGAPENVKIKLDGQPVDLASFKNGQTARFELPFEDRL